jgi:hypothetical protein
MQAWKLEDHDGVDKYEKHIRSWMESQATEEDGDQEWDMDGLLWVYAAKFLLAHIERMCFRVHLRMRKVYRAHPGPPEEKWPTFEETMSKSHLSPFGACVMTMWLLDSVMPPDARVLIGLAERIDGNDVMPVIMVMEAGLMVIDPTGLVTGWRPRRLMHVKGWVVNRAFDATGSYSLRKVIVNEDDVTSRRINR